MRIKILNFKVKKNCIILNIQKTLFSIKYKKKVTLKKILNSDYLMHPITIH